MFTALGLISLVASPYPGRIGQSESDTRELWSAGPYGCHTVSGVLLSPVFGSLVVDGCVLFFPVIGRTLKIAVVGTFTFQEKSIFFFTVRSLADHPQFAQKKGDEEK